jgi:hypothetical protein
VLGKVNQWGYCADHVGVALACVMSSEGCRGRVGAWSRSRICPRHPRSLIRKALLVGSVGGP